MLRAKVLALVLALSAGAGCSFTTMETARQLESGEAVVGAALDWPGLLYIPRASAYGKVGLGDRADLGLQGGFAIATANAGATARLYPSNWLTMSLQTEVVFVVDDIDSFFEPIEDNAALLVFTPRISTAVNERDFLYGGVQSTILNGWAYNESGTQTEFGFQAAAFSVFGGVEVEFARGLNLQTELMLSPLTFDGNGVSSLYADGSSLTRFQWSVGVNYRFGGDPDPVRRMEPSEAPKPEEPVREQPTPEPEPEPEPTPEYDEGGVPIY